MLKILYPDITYCFLCFYFYGRVFKWRIHLYKTRTQFLFKNLLLVVKKKKKNDCSFQPKGCNRVLQDPFAFAVFTCPRDGHIPLALLSATLEANAGCLLGFCSFSLQFNTSLEAPEYQQRIQRVRFYHWVKDEATVISWHQCTEQMAL